VQRISTLQALLLGAIPTLLFAIIALAVWEPRRPADLAEEPGASGPAAAWAPEGARAAGPSDSDEAPDDEEASGATADVDRTDPAPATGTDPVGDTGDESLGVVDLAEIDRVSGVAGAAAAREPGRATAAEDDAGVMVTPGVDPAEPDAGLAAEDAGGAGGAGGAAVEALATEAPAGPPCGSVMCESGWVCCNASCGICTLPGEGCSQRTCGMPYSPSSVTCGPVTCDVGELCCNPACGECILPGQPCNPRTCLNPVTIPYSETCGMTTCSTGMVCCNPSCGICKPPGEPCSREVCE
jgi:hypothetical protein